MSVAAGSDPFTNALMRAKEIAANIKKPTGREEEEEYEDTYDNRKRPLNGAGGNVQSEFDGHYPPEGQPQSKRPMMDGGGGGYMNQQSEGGLKDEIRVPSSCVKFLIGDNGETLSKLQSHCNVHIPPPGPDPHAERAIILTGSKQCIEQCKEQIRDVLQKNAGAGGGMPPMGGMGQMQGGGYGGQMGGQGGSPQMPIETVDMLIPQNKVGLIIGKGGETIKDLQVQSGCRMNMVQDGMYQNAPEKPLRMSGDTAAIQKARELVSGLLQQDFGGRGNNNNSNFRPNNGPFECTKNLAVPKEYVGVVIGRSGDTIRRLQEETGCKVQFNTVDQGQPGDRWLIMQGTQEACEKAESNVKDMLGKVMQKDAKFGGPNTQTVEYQVPANKCGLVIGKGGESIRQMKEQSGAHIEMNKHAPHDAPTKAFTIRGTQQQIEAAQQLIAQRIGEPGEGGGYGGGQGGYGGGGHGGGGHGGHHQSPGGMQHPGQRMPGHPNPMMAGPQGGAAPAAMAYQAQAQQQQAYYQAYYQQQAYMAQMQGAQMQGAPGANPAAAAAPTPAAAPAGAAGGDSQSVQQQWAAYYQQLVQLYGEQQAQTYWTQLSQHQNAQQGGAPQTSQFDQQQ